jgi:putative tryptophan/tyrosine transport system substrate-binding protein
MRRREFIAGLGGVAAVWSSGTSAQQQREQTKRIGMLLNLGVNDPESLDRLAAFAQSLQELGWIVGRNLRIESRLGAADVERSRRQAAELVALAPEVILASGAPSVIALLQATRSVPIVFTNVVDPVGSGFVESLARPGGNVTGFSLFEYSIGGKWLGLLKEIAPHVVRVAVLRDPTLASGGGQLGALQAVAPPFAVELTPISVRDPGEIERTVTAFARVSNGGLIVTGSTQAADHRDLIIALAARHRLPAVYSQRYMTVGGGLISYGPDSIEPYRRAAGYVDRILKGEKPADLPVQAPSKYELVVNLKTAKALGLIIPETLLATADEVIQ